MHEGLMLQANCMFGDSWVFRLAANDRKHHSLRICPDVLHALHRNPLKPSSWPNCLHVQIDKCFGFDTAVEEAQRALMAAKVEASSAFRGIGIVKLMGRQSGFIAMQVRKPTPFTQAPPLFLDMF